MDNYNEQLITSFTSLSKWKILKPAIDSARKLSADSES